MPAPLHVLIAEDNPRDAELTLLELRRGGFEPDWIRVDSEEDFRANLHPGLDVILSDYRMPQFTGLRALELLKESGLDIPFLIVSGTIGEELAVEIMRLGATDYLLKDRLARLGPAVQHALSESRSRRERRAAVEALRLRELALGEVSQGVLICDADHSIIYANESFTAITGHPREEILGSSCDALLRGPETDPETSRQILAALDAGQAFEGEILHYRKDGTPFWNDFSLAPIRDPDGGPVRFISIHRDVTERKNFETALQWRTALFEAMTDSSPDGILVVERHGGHFFQNERMAEIWGIPPDILRSAKLTPELQFLARRATNPNALADKFAHLHFHPETTSRQEIELVTGAILDCFTAPIRGKAGEYYGRIWVFRDVTEERRREKQLATALEREKQLAIEAQSGNRAKSEFLAVMSHEIRTPMNSILGFSELLASSPALPNECREHVRTIISSGEALLRILNDVLDFSRLEAGDLRIEKVLFSAHEVLQDIHTLLSPQARHKRLDFHLSIEEDAPKNLRNDAGRLRQILLNLVGNAIKFTEVGSITLGIRDGGGNGLNGGSFVEFYIQDTGLGVPESELDNIFDPFVQADSSISRRFGGAGLGLSIARRLVELMGGRLTVASQAGSGSLFVVNLPAEPGAGELFTARSPSESKLDESFASEHPLSILLVEDDAVNLKLMRMMLRKLGYEPLVAHDGDEAVEIYSSERPDCILMDLQMPRKDGLQATQEIRTLERAASSDDHIFISALTANIVAENRQQCFDVGMDAYLNKPIKCALLARTLEQACARKAVH
jgi:PAS domain S-box-containing protein